MQENTWARLRESPTYFPAYLLLLLMLHIILFNSTPMHNIKESGMDPGVSIAWRDRQRGRGGRVRRRLPRHHSGGEDARPRRVRNRATARPPLRTGLQPLPAKNAILHRVTRGEQAQRTGAVLGHPVPDLGTAGGGILL